MNGPSGIGGEQPPAGEPRKNPQQKEKVIFPSDPTPKHPLRAPRRDTDIRNEWLGRELYRFNDRDVWRVRDAVEGTQIFGGTGSGKTSGSGLALATGMLRAGFGGLVLTAKPDDRPTWEMYFKAAGVPTEDRLIVLSPESGHRFNALSYEYLLGGTADRPGDTRRLVNLFMTALGSGEGQVSQSDPFWTDTLRELVTHAVDLVAFASGSVAERRFVPPSAKKGIPLADVAELIRTAPQTSQEAKSPAWLRESRCGQRLLDADAIYRQLRPDEPRRDDIKDTVHYWLHTFPTLSDRTRSVIVSSFSSKANELLRQPLRDLFCTTTSDDVTPDATYRGKVVLLDLPVKQYGEAGRLAQVLYKTVWQHATETTRRWQGGGDAYRPVFLWADESQLFVTNEDVMFQATARSQLAATVYLTQNISNYHHALGGTRSSATDSLLGSLQMKVFHSNGDPATNEWAERVFGTDLFRHSSPSSSTAAKGGLQFGISHQRSREPNIPASSFTKLQRGGGKQRVTEAFLFHAGRRWSSESDHANHLLHRFSQSLVNER